LKYKWQGDTGIGRDRSTGQATVTSEWDTYYRQHFHGQCWNNWLITGGKINFVLSLTRNQNININQVDISEHNKKIRALRKHVEIYIYICIGICIYIISRTHGGKEFLDIYTVPYNINIKIGEFHYLKNCKSSLL
jgi:ribosomal protein S19